MFGRIVAALCHGAFFGVGAVVAADMVAPNKRAGAIALMFTGLTTANVLGVPLGHLPGPAIRLALDLLGHHRHRRRRVASASLLLVPPTPGSADRSPDCAANSVVFRRPQVWVSIAVTILGFGGMFGAFTYIAYTLTEVSGFASSTVPWLLVALRCRAVRRQRHRRQGGRQGR